MKKTNNICNEITALANTHLMLDQWGFRESARVNEAGDIKVPLVVYSSEWCKVRLAFNEWHPPHQIKEYSIDIYYGRLSAPNNKNISNWNNEKCHCWHGIVKVLHFIDGSTPKYATKNLFSHGLIKEFKKRYSYKDLLHKLPEWEIRKHSFIWEQYAPQLFELFDLRNPGLWKKYQQFLKEMYDIRGRSPNIKPPLDSVC